MKKVWGQATAAPTTTTASADSHYGSSNNLNIVRNDPSEQTSGGLELVPVVTINKPIVGSAAHKKDNKKEMLANALFAGVVSADAKGSSSDDSDDSDNEKKKKKRKKDRKKDKKSKVAA